MQPDVVHRRWHQGLAAFFDLYSDIVGDWELIDNSDTQPVLVARRRDGLAPEILAPDIWRRLKTAYGSGSAK